MAFDGGKGGLGGSIRNPPAVSVLLFVLFGIGTIFPGCLQGAVEEIPGQVERIASGGRLIRFPVPTAVDRLLVPALDPDFWGEGFLGKVLIASSAHGATLGTRNKEEEWIPVTLRDPETTQVAVYPVLAETTQRVARENWRFEGSQAWKRKIERELGEAFEKVIEWQAQKGCFSCHQIIPLGMAVSVAREKGIHLPETLIASQVETMISFQNRDGAFRFPGTPYGVVSPTLCGAFFLGLLREIQPGLEEPFVRSVSWLAKRQQPDGSLVPDFSFPAFMVGKSFGTCLFLKVLAWAQAMTENRRPEIATVLSAGLIRSRDWFRSSNRRDRSFKAFSLLALPESGIFPEEEAFEILRGLASDCAQIDPKRDPAMRVVLEGLFISFGGNPIALPPWPSTTDVEGSHRFWKILSDLLRENPR